MIHITHICEDSLGLLMVIPLVAISGPPRKGSGFAPPPRWSAPKSEFPSSSFWLIYIKRFGKYPAMLSVRRGSHALGFLFHKNDVFSLAENSSKSGFAVPRRGTQEMLEGQELTPSIS